MSKIETLGTCTNLLTMKAINDTVVNLGTGLLVLIASSIICAPHPDQFHWEVPNEVRIIFLSITALIALTNVTGIPKQHDRWQSFGKAYFYPFFQSQEQQQQMAGIMETVGILLTLMGFPIMRGFGYALLMVLYGRGALVHAQLGDFTTTGLAGSVSLLAGLLLKDEFYTVL